VFLAAL